MSTTVAAANDAIEAPGTPDRVIRIQQTEERAIDTAFATLSARITELKGTLDLKPYGGGIHQHGSKLIIVDNDGQLFVYEKGSTDQSLTRLNIETENNKEAFIEYATEQNVSWKDAAGKFRYIDVITLEKLGGYHLILSHHYWDPDSKCFTLRFSAIEIEPDETLETLSRSAGDWSTIYDTKPCLRLKASDEPFAGHQSGGRIVGFDRDTLLVTVGDFGFDGLNSEYNYPQDPDTDYGKVLKIHLDTGQSETFSMGHRNPQGLAQDHQGNIWLTEHGPQGGDELNLISEGRNYGWPHEVFGSNYGSKDWPLAQQQGRHDIYTRPIYAWVPSIGVSNVMQVQGFLPAWDGDLLVGSLIQLTLFRARYREGRVVFVEPIVIGERVRDLDQSDDGTIVLWTDNGSLIELMDAPTITVPAEEIMKDIQEPVRTKAIQAINSCRECHSFSEHVERDGAPSLWRVFGRRIAGSEYQHYSDALKSKSGIWTGEALDAFLQDAQAFAPGTRMSYSGIPDGEVRQATIKFLQSLK